MFVFVLGTLDCFGATGLRLRRAVWAIVVIFFVNWRERGTSAGIFVELSNLWSLLNPSFEQRVRLIEGDWRDDPIIQGGTTPGTLSIFL